MINEYLRRRERSTRQTKRKFSLPVRGENVVKMLGDVDVRGQAEAQHRQIFAMQDERAVDHVDEQRDVPHRRRFAVQIEENTGNQFDPKRDFPSTKTFFPYRPVVFVQHVQVEQFFVEKRSFQAEIRFQRFAREQRTFHQFVVEERHRTVDLVERGVFQQVPSEENFRQFGRLEEKRALFQLRLRLFRIDRDQRQLRINVSMEIIKIANVSLGNVNLLRFQID